jgi:glycosyltransferase involved in cell wall biosynthesis
MYACLTNNSLIRVSEMQERIESSAPIGSTIRSALKFTIAIPVYNCETYLPAAIESALNQTLPQSDYEILVLDNCSSDKSYSIACSYGSRVAVRRHAENIGGSANFNQCFFQAQGENIVILHADDMLPNNYLEVLADVLDKYQDVDVVLTKCKLIDCAGGIIGEGWPQPPSVGILNNALRDLALYRYAPMPTWVTRKRFVDRYGGFDLTLKYASDMDFIMKVAACSILYYAPMTGAYRRLHNGNNGTREHKLGFDIEDSVVLLDRYLPMLNPGKLMKLRIVCRGLLLNLWTTMRYGLDGDTATVEIRSKKLLEHPYQSTVTRLLCRVLLFMCTTNHFRDACGWAFKGNSIGCSMRRAIYRYL